ALNKYRLRHLESEGHTGAIRASQLLSRPDRLIGLILLGNNFVNIFAASVATIIGIKLFGEKGVVISSISLTLIVLLFAEVTPKTYAAIHPERLAFPASYILKPLLFILFPLVWFINLITNQLLQFLGINPDDKITAAINSEELKMALTEAGSMIPKRHKKMLMGI
ncbi:MAG TPA: magnesium/cobalt efflux protein, partial [Gammaproteobacteria bacterium]|nr:magnesium/cobalt efflux protein [Gammaproteobacteria bacterium]